MLQVEKDSQMQSRQMPSSILDACDNFILGKCCSCHISFQFVLEGPIEWQRVLCERRTTSLNFWKVAVRSPSDSRRERDANANSLDSTAAE